MTLPPPHDANLQAWNAWEECFRAYEYLEGQDSAGDDPLWKIVWIAILTLLRTTRDVLEKVDKRASELHACVIEYFTRDLHANRKLHLIYWEFICRERNNIVHEFSLGAQSHRVTSRPFLVDTELTYQQLVQKYGERKEIIWGEEMEDGLRLAGIGLSWWESNLRVIDQAIRAEERKPFSSGIRLQTDLENASYSYRPARDG